MIEFILYALAYLVIGINFACTLRKLDIPATYTEYFEYKNYNASKNSVKDYSNGELGFVVIFWPMFVITLAGEFLLVFIPGYLIARGIGSITKRLCGV